MLIVHGKQDGLIHYSEGERIVREAGDVAELITYEEGNHVCNNIPYKWRPLVADWLAERL